MVNNFREVTSELFKLKPWMLVGGLLCFLFFMLWQLYYQFQQAEQVFVKQTQTLEKSFLLEEQRTTTLLKALAHYYSGQIIKSDKDFSLFAQSLVPNHPFIDSIGLAKIVNNENKSRFEQYQKKLGFKSFEIRSKRLFHESTVNLTDDYLAITRITPLSPKHSIYIGEDLFSLNTLHKEFFALSRENQIGLYWLNQSYNGKRVVLLNHPIYRINPNDLNAEQRQQEIQGIIFLLFNIDPLLIQKSKNVFGDQLSRLEMVLERNPVRNYWNVYQQKNGASKNGSYFENKFQQLIKLLSFKGKIQISQFRPEIRLVINAHWNLKSIETGSVLLAGFSGLMIYLVIILLFSMFFGHARSLMKMQSRLKEILHTSHDAVIITNSKGIIQSWNPRAEELFGFQREEMIGQSLPELFMHLSEDNLADPVEQKLLMLFDSKPSREHLENQAKLLELYLLNRDKQRILIEISYSILSVEDSEEISLFIQDITYQRQAETEIKHLAYYDSLTKLENRVLFKRNFEKSLNKPNPQPFSLFFIDLDGFKEVNDTLGHSIGDELLKVIAKRITNTIKGAHRPYNICRFGGDEFIIMIESPGEKLSRILLERLLQKIKRTIRLDGNELEVSASIGVATYPEHGQDMDTLLRHADTAMYEAKKLGKNTFSTYQNEMTEHLSQRLLIEKHLRQALKNNEFFLVYQPQMDLASGRVIGVEALIRWQSPELGFIRPDQFIAIAEESKLIIEIGDWVADTCIHQLKEWINTDFANLHIAINVSSVQFAFPGFIDSVRHKMDLAGLPAGLLEIELTERTVMDNPDENVQRFNDIRHQGFGLSVDDFGTGYSSLSYLKLFPLSILKIDKSFVDGLPTDENDISIANAILNLAHSLNIKVVAEGVETIEQLLFLKHAKCNYAQGYFISKPLKTEELEIWLKEHSDSFYQSELFLNAQAGLDNTL